LEIKPEHLGGLAAGAVGIIYIRGLVKSWVSGLNATLAVQSKRLDDLIAGLDANAKANAALADGGTYLAGLNRIATAQVAEVIKLRESISRFSDLIAPNEAKGKDAVSNYDEYEADIAFAKQAHMASGLTAEQAQQAVDYEEQVKLLPRENVSL
jgi:hypothetical protein